MRSHKVPGSKTISEASALLNVLGGGSAETKKLLESIRQATSEFEALKADAVRMKKEADKLMDEAKTEKNIAVNEMSALSKNREAFRKETEEKNKALDSKAEKIILGENALKSERDGIEKDKSDFIKEMDDMNLILSNRTIEIDKRETQVKERESKINRFIEAITPLSRDLVKVLNSL